MSSQTQTKHDPTALTDAKHRQVYEEPSDVNDIIHRKHLEHMRRIDQDGWLKKLFQKADQMKAEPSTRSRRNAKTTGRKK